MNHQIIRKAGYENWTDEQLKDFLFNNQFPDEHLQLFVNNWSRESSKVNIILSCNLIMDFHFIVLSPPI